MEIIGLLMALFGFVISHVASKPEDKKIAKAVMWVGLVLALWWLMLILLAVALFSGFRGMAKFWSGVKSGFKSGCSK